MAIFDGGHVWLSSELALEAVEWMELQAMASGRTPRNQAWIDARYAARLPAAQRLTGAQAALAFTSLAVDFGALRDVAEVSAKAAALRKDKTVEIRSSAKRRRRMASARKFLSCSSLSASWLTGIPEAWPWANYAINGSGWRQTQPRQQNHPAAASPAVSRVGWLAMSAQEHTADPEYLELVATFRPSLKRLHLPGVALW